MATFAYYLILVFLEDYEEELGSDEESGKSWSELEEEASKGKKIVGKMYFN